MDTPSASRTAYQLSSAAAVTATLAAGWTLLRPEVLRGPAVMNGSARGTALVVLLVAVPVLLASMTLAAAGRSRARITWLAALGYLFYNALLFLFLTPFNQAFLAYLAMLSTALWAGLLTWQGLAARGRFAPTRGTRLVAALTWLIVALNAAAWLRAVVAGLGDPAAFIAGSGVATNVIYVQDLAVWLPLAAVAAAWLWQGRVLGLVAVAVLLGLWTIESVSIAVDQWLGHAADPASPLASGDVVLPFLLAAAVTGAATAWLLKRIPAPSAEPVSQDGDLGPALLGATRGLEHDRRAG